MKVAVLFAATGFSAIASAAIATITPCPSCPVTARPSPITVTSQYQPVSTCTPSQTCTTDTAVNSASSATLTCRLEPDCTTYSFVSTVIPFLAGSSSTTVTELDAIVTIDHTSTVLTSLIPVTTTAPIFNGTLAKRQNSTFVNTTYTLTRYETLVIDTWCPYNEMGPLAIPGYAGSGLCKACTADPNQLSQVVTVRDCVNNSTCGLTTKTWISKLPIATSTSQVAVSTRTALPSGGTYVIPIVTVCQPYDNHYNPVTKSFAVTTAVYYPTIIQITKIIDITFIGHPAPTASTTLSECPLSTSTYCPTNGIHTVPMVTTIYPTIPGYGSPIIIDIDYTITVINAPTFIFPTTIIIVTLTSTPETVTVISGTTVTAPVTTTVTTTTTDNGQISPIPASETTDTFSASETFSFSETEASFSASETISASEIFSASETISASESFSASETISASETFSVPESEVTSFPGVTSTIETAIGTATESEATSTTGSIALEPTAQSLAEFDFLGCYGSAAGLEEFNLQFVSNDLTPEICAEGCRNAGFPYSGTYQTECYCAATLNPADQVSAGACGLSCPGDVTLSCGNNAAFRKRLRVRLVNPSKLLDVYQFNGVTSSTALSVPATETSSIPESTDTNSIIQSETTTIESETSSVEPTDSFTIDGPTVTFSTGGPLETGSTTFGPTDSFATDGPTVTSQSGEPSETGSSTDPIDIGSTTTITSTAAPTPEVLEAFDFVGCLGSSAGFPSFNLELTSAQMTPELCTDTCLDANLIYSGIYQTECYCAATVDSTSVVGDQACGLPCPGDPNLSCGGNAGARKMLRVRAVDPSKLLDVYVYEPTTTTTKIPTSTATDTMSDGPEPTLEPRAIDADMELNKYKQRARQLRRGGMLRGEKKSNANLRVKRDFGMRNPFGL